LARRFKVKMEKKYLLIPILLLAFFLRLYKLSEFPVGFHIDEAQVGYNAYSLLKTAKDEFGNFLPHHLNVVNTGRPMGLFYLTAPSIAVFGLNEFAVRLPTAILGVLSIIVFYFLVNELFINGLKWNSKLVNSLTRNKSIALTSSFLLAISPWHIIFSRSGIENMLELFNVLIGTLFLFSGLRKKRKSNFFFAYFFFLFAYFSYMASRVFVPLLLIGFGTIFFKNLKKKKLLKAFLFTSILYFIFPFGLFMFKSEAISRFKQVSVFTNPGVQLQLEEQIREDGGIHPLVTRFFHNKILNHSFKFFENYQEYFTGKFLFSFGGFPMRFRIPQMGVLYFFEPLFLLLGLLFLFKKRKKEHLFILFWLFTAPIAASLTIEDIPNFQRALLMIPALAVIVAVGILQVISFFKKLGCFKLCILGISLCYLYGLTFFLHQYFHHQKVHRPWYRNWEMKELVKEISEREDDYDKIVMTKNETEPYIFFLFYNKVEPVYYQGKSSELNWKGTWAIDDYIFDQRDCPLLQEESPSEDRLYVEREICKLESWIKVIGEIKRPDGSTALRLEEFDKDEFKSWND